MSSNKTFGEKIDEILLYVHNSGRMADRKLADTKPEDILPWLNVDQAKQAILNLIKSDVIGQPLSWKDFRGVTFDSYDDAVESASFITIERQRSILRGKAE